jgi:Short C-terminal domain
MGFLDGLFGSGGGRMEDPVRGTAQVVACSGYRGRGVMQNCHMQLVITAEGVPATAVEHQGLVHNSRWPAPGMSLPVTVDRADPRRYKIEWDEVADSRDRSRQTAEGLAAAMRGEGGAPGGLAGLGGAGGMVVNLSGRDVSQLSDEQKAKLRMLGIDPEQLAAQQGAASPPQPDAGDDRIEALERLARLHEQGALTDEEFAAEKRRVLGG